MEELRTARDKYKACLSALERSIKRFSRKDLDDDIREGLIADLVKHNEMAFEAAIKFLDSYLISHSEKRIVGGGKTRTIIRECFTRAIISKEVAEGLIEIADVRNATVHEYSQENVLESCSRISHYYVIFQKLPIIKE